MEILISEMRDSSLGKELRLYWQRCGLYESHTSDVGINAWFGKVAYHAMDQEQAERPSWSIIFGGDSYMILFLSYTADANDKQRIAIFCSGILSIYHNGEGPDVNATRKLPVCSAIVYMLLSTHEVDLTGETRS